MSAQPLSWSELEVLDTLAPDPVNGPTNSQSCLRLFGRSEDDIRVTFFRDNHAWCPYCQKVWLWLEEQRVPYRVKKITMFCYGQKEAWFQKRVPSGMLPALELDGRLITESDDILLALEQAFSPLQYAMQDSRVMPLRQLERLLFRAWCGWLCCPARSERQEQFNRQQFIEVMEKSKRPWRLPTAPTF